jgi:hypothetical protein
VTFAESVGNKGDASGCVVEAILESGIVAESDGVGEGGIGVGANLEMSGRIAGDSLEDENEDGLAVATDLEASIMVAGGASVAEKDCGVRVVVVAVVKVEEGKVLVTGARVELDLELFLEFLVGDTVEAKKII